MPTEIQHVYKGHSDSIPRFNSKFTAQNHQEKCRSKTYVSLHIVAYIKEWWDENCDASFSGHNPRHSSQLADVAPVVRLTCGGYDQGSVEGHSDIIGHNSRLINPVAAFVCS